MLKPRLLALSPSVVARPVVPAVARPVVAAAARPVVAAVARPLVAAVALVAAALVLPAVAAADGATAQAAAYSPGEVVVRYERGTDRRTQAAVQRAAGVGRPRAFAPRTRLLQIRDGASVAETVRELRDRPEVATAAPNARARLSQFIPRDPGNTGVEGGWQELQWNFLPGAGVNAPAAWQHLLNVGRPGGRGTVVAVLDTGVAYATRRRFRKSTDFQRADFVRGFDFVDDDRFPHDENGHGTHVASTIGESTHNDRGVTGLAYGAKIMPVRVLNHRGEGESAAITAGIRYAARHGADVINLSFEFDDTFRQFAASEIPDVLAAIRFANRRGVVVVAAAGNFERSAISYPARAQTVIAVGATTEHGCRAKYSNVGRGIDLVAPGGGPDDTADPTCPKDLPEGRDIYQTTFPWAGVQSAPRSTSSYRRFGLPSGFIGTSMAAPHVAAAAALVIASGVLGPDPSPQAVQDRLQLTVADAGAPGYDEAYGHGRLDAGGATDPLR
jgi:serine protease